MKNQNAVRFTVDKRVPQVALVTKNIGQVSVYVDGARPGPPGVGPGGWGAAILYQDKEILIYGGMQNVTSNQMEIYAATKALTWVKENLNCSSVAIFSDSQYVVNSLTKWISKWNGNHWNKRGGMVSNTKWLIALWKVSLSTNARWKWVRGHNGNSYNELADELANEGAEKQVDNVIMKICKPHKHDSINLLATQKINKSGMINEPLATPPSVKSNKTPSKRDPKTGHLVGGYQAKPKKKKPKKKIKPSVPMVPITPNTMRKIKNKKL